MIDEDDPIKEYEIEKGKSFIRFLIAVCLITAGIIMLIIYVKAH